jgi:tetraacyldisaccharide 4'-kinase
MLLHDLFQRLSDDAEPDGGMDSALQTAMSAASPIYGVGAWINRTLHESGFSERKRLPAVVLSVGNLTLGGTGKTPFCLWLSEFLKAEGRRPAILTRGYGREDEGRLVLVHDGRKLRADASEAGDEAVLLARSLGDVPVVACADRYRAGRVLLRRYETDTIVLDDGFQHHRLERQGDIVLVDATKPLSLLRLFPRGTLREPLSALSRAHLVVITRWNQADEPKRVYREVRRAAPEVPVVRAAIEPGNIVRACDNSEVAREAVNGKRAILICGVGNPDSVKKTLAELGIKPVASKILQDHEPISGELLRKAELRRAKSGADFIIVTEKDAVKFAASERLPESVLFVRPRLRLISSRDRELARRVLRARLSARLVAGYLK